MAVEMSASRLLSPYFGNTLFVWTNLIGLIMLALSIGYFWGGRLADKNPVPQAYFLLILFAAIWILFLPFYSKLVVSSVLSIFPTLVGLVQWGSFISVLLLLIVPMVLLGMIIPYTVKMLALKIKDIGGVAGRVSSVSTIGSILGTFLPAFVFIPFLGTTKTFILLGVLLFFVAAVGLRLWWVYILAAASVVLFWFVPPVFADSAIIVEVDSPYNHIFVKERESGRREFYLNNQFGMQSVYEPAGPLVKEYYSYYSVLPEMAENTKKILILGHAGGSFTRIFNAYYPEISITGVELDPAVTFIAKEYFHLDSANVEIVHADARSFLNTTSEKFDLIIMDAYNVTFVPSHLATQEFFQLVDEHLNEGGVLAMNAISHESDFLNILTNTLCGVFSKVLRAEIPTSENSIIVVNKGGDFSISEVQVDLQKYKDYLEGNGHIYSQKEGEKIFTDDKSALVELKTQEMMTDLFSR